MGQRGAPRPAVNHLRAICSGRVPPGVRGILLLGVVCLNIACDRPGAKPQSPPDAARASYRAGAAPVKQPSVASLSPAATDLLVGMGAADHLVAVSNFDADRGSIAALPRVGDYRTQDWEKLSALRPAKMIVQVHEDRLPSGLRDRAQELGIELVNINIDDLPEVFDAIPKLGRAVGEEAKAQEAERALRKQFETLRKRVERARAAAPAACGSSPTTAGRARCPAAPASPTATRPSWAVATSPRAARSSAAM